MSYLDELRQRQMMGSQQVGAPESSYLYSNASEMSAPMPSQNALGSKQMSESMASPANMADVGTAAAGGAMMGGPAGAGIMVGGQLASSYLNNKAAAERAKRERAAQIAEQYGQDQLKGIQIAQDAFRGAFL